ncbi:MAG TPA: YceI family protein [Flavobacteriaceae bacterium]|nr:YceI family protein [Flavobacteriaceae bacterium]
MNTTQKFFALTVALFISVSMVAQSTWNVDKAHAKVNFSTVHNTISDVEGLFNAFEISIVSDEKDFSDAQFTVEIDVNSIDTEIEMRDNHLRSADFFEVEKYPKMTFKSTSIEETDEDNHYRVKGNLTLKGITKPVTMDVWYRGTIENDKGQKIAGFQVLGNIDRFDFNVGNDFPEALISNEVAIKVDGEFIKE